MPRSTPALCAIAAALTLAACSADDNSDTPEPAFQAELRLTTYGVPHVSAADFASLGFGVAQAYLKDNLCALADQVVTVNGERSNFFGPEGAAIVSFVPLPNRESDFFYKAYLDDAALAQAFEQASPEVHELLRGYIAGYNEALQAQADAPSSCRAAPWLRPIALRDFLRLLGDKAVLAGGAAFARAIAGARPTVPAASTSTSSSTATKAARRPRVPPRARRGEPGVGRPHRVHAA